MQLDDNNLESTTNNVTPPDDRPVQSVDESLSPEPEPERAEEEELVPFPDESDRTQEAEEAMIAEDASYPELSDEPERAEPAGDEVEMVEMPGNSLLESGEDTDGELLLPEPELAGPVIDETQPEPETIVEDEEEPVAVNSHVRIEPLPILVEEADDDEELPPVEKPQRKPTRHTRREARRLAKYAEIRREQYEEFNDLLDVLTRVDELPDETLNQVRDAIFHADHPFLLTLVGPFSAGKSSLINALLGETVLEVGPIPTTDHIAILRYGPTVQKTRTGETSTVFYPAPLLEGISLVDTPGLESVFEKHDQLTLRFLHRADIVLLVMLATQVLTASDLEFMRNLRQYGKRLIIVVNQIDVLEEEDRETVREFVEEQARLHLGFEPQIWLVSAKQAMKAFGGEVRDEIIWDQSGMADVEEYLEETLDDSERVRQKLETPLTVAKNATQNALDYVRTSQKALSEHRKTVDNINAQIEAAEASRRRQYDKLIEDINKEWTAAIEGGEEAINELFQFSRALSQSIGGMLELVGIGAFFRRFRKQTKAQEAFAEHQVRESLQRVPEITNRIGATLEGRDLEDIDGLVDYTREHMKQLPPNLQNKVIGKIQAPMSYDRKPLRDIRGDLDDIIKDASQFETTRIDRALRAMMVVAGVWELLIIILAVVVGTGEIDTGFNIAVTVLFFLVLALVGLALIPLRGQFLKMTYRRRMMALQSNYQEVLDRAARKQIEYGTQLRRDVVAPFTRMIETQADLNNTLKTDLEHHDQKITNIQHSLSALLG